ncbi:MAG: FAD/NAD(P)-binding protein [Solirubrobacterales bacterium]
MWSNLSRIAEPITSLAPVRPSADPSSESGPGGFERVVIVGGGAAGALLAIALLKEGGGRPLALTIVEPRAQVGRGVAYSTPDPLHLLNVPAESMSALESEPAHFLRWAEARGLARDGCAFVPRREYGAYLADTYAAALAAAPGATVEVIRDRVERIELGTSARATLSSGATLVANRVVLALGNGPTRTPARVEPELLASPRFVADPWCSDPRELAGAGESVLLIGTGLTMVDVALSLGERGARMLTVSRSGLAPRGHRPGQPRQLLTFPLADGAGGIADLMQAFFGELTRATALGGDLSDVVDSMRPVTQRIWVSLGEGERRWFLANLRRHWEVNRHRMAPEVDARVQRLRSRGALRLERAGVESLGAAGGRVVATLRRGGAREEVGFDRVVNCAGPEDDVRRLADEPLRSLLAAGAVRPDPLGLGLDVDLDGAAISAGGSPQDQLRVIGPLRKGSLWETTAIPEIRRQAADLAQLLLAGPRLRTAARGTAA